MTVPTSVPTCSYLGGNEKTARFCGFEPSVPTVPTYLVYFIEKVVGQALRQFLPEKYAKKVGTVGTVAKSRGILRAARVPTCANVGTVRWEQ